MRKLVVYKIEIEWDGNEESLAVVGYIYIVVYNVMAICQTTNCTRNLHIFSTVTGSWLLQGKAVTNPGYSVTVV